MDTWLVVIPLLAVGALMVAAFRAHHSQLAHKAAVFEELKGRHVTIGLEHVVGHTGRLVRQASGVVRRVDGRGNARRLLLDDVPAGPHDPARAEAIGDEGVPLRDVQWVRGAGTSVTWGEYIDSG